MAEGQITIKDIITDEGLNWGVTYAKNVQVAIDKNEELKASAKLLLDSYTKISNSTDLATLSKNQALASERADKASKAYVGRAGALAKVDEERQRQLKNLLTVKNRLQNVNTNTNKQLIEERTKLAEATREIKKNATAMGQLEQKRFIALKNVENLNAKRALGIKLSNEEQKELKQSTVEFNKYNKAFKIIKNGTGQFNDNVGNYPKGLKLLGGAVKQLIPVLGLAAGIKFGVGFLKDSRDVALKAKGIEFAYKRLGAEGEIAFEKVRKSTRGLLSDLDLKTALVEFDNFNISLEETDTLFEFLAVRATQTGKSIEELQSSLVEGLSKESKLRIDNLGISTQVLNDELKKTPNFVQAVANIAKKEVAEAGNILDDAGNSQSKWNAALQDFQVNVGSGVFATITDGLFKFGTNVLRAITPVKSLTEEIQKEQVGLNVLVNSITAANVSEDERLKLITKLKNDYPFFLKLLKTEKTDNENLSIALQEVNQLYIKRIALKTQEKTIEELLNKVSDKALDNTKRKIKIDTQLADINVRLLKGSLDLTNKSQEEQTRLVVESLKLSDGYINASTRKGVKIGEEAREINKLTAKLTIYEGGLKRQGNLNDELIEQQDLMKKIEAELGVTLEELNKIFGLNTIAKKSNIETTKEQIDTSKKINIALEDQFNLEKLRLQQNIAIEQAIINNSKAKLGARLLATKDYVDEADKLLILEKDRAITIAGDRADEVKRIELQYSLDYATLIRQREDSVKDILKDGFTQAKDRIDQGKKLQEEEIKKRIDLSKKALDLDLSNENLSAIEKQNRVEQYEKDVLDIKKNYAVQKIQEQKSLVNKEIELAEKTFLRRKILGKTTQSEEQQYFENIKNLKQLEASISIDLDNAVRDNAISNNKDKADAEQKLLQIKKDAIADASGVIADSLNIDSANLERFITGLTDGFESTIEALSAGISVFGNVVNSIYDGNIDNIDRQLEANDEYYNRQYDLAEGDREQQDLIREEQELKRKSLEKEKIKEQEKQAKFQKAQTIVQIGIQTALGVISALAQVPKFDFGISASALAVTIGALGAAQIAAVLAKPIPKYEKGTNFHPGGMAEVGEVRPEVVIEPNKNPYIVSQPTVLPLARGTKVVSSLEAYNKLKGASILQSLNMQDNNLGAYERSVIVDVHTKELTNEMKRNTKAVENLKLKVNMPNQKAPDFNFGAYKFNQTNWS